jgi:hypothetical protein
VSARCTAVVGRTNGKAAEGVYARLALAILAGDKVKARQIFYDEMLPDHRFSDGEMLRLSYRIGAIDEGDQYLANAVEAGANGLHRAGKKQAHRLDAMLIPGEIVEAVFETTGGCTAFVGITNRRVIIHDRAFLHRHQATVSIPYSKISSVAAKVELARPNGRAGWASCELILTTSAGDFELGFRGAERARQAHCLILQHLI